MDQGFRSLLDAIAAAVGDVPGDVADEHRRWHLYERAIVASAGLDPLQRAVAGEPDRALATTVVLRMLERVPDGEQAGWIERLQPADRATAERRAGEIRTLRRAGEGELTAAEAAGLIGTWSDWLQLRLAGQSTDPELLAILAALGRTRRIRNTATAVLKALSR